MLKVEKVGRYFEKICIDEFFLVTRRSRWECILRLRITKLISSGAICHSFVMKVTHAPLYHSVGHFFVNDARNFEVNAWRTRPVPSRFHKPATFLLPRCAGRAWHVFMRAAAIRLTMRFLILQDTCLRRCAGSASTKTNDEVGLGLCRLTEISFPGLLFYSFSLLPRSWLLRSLLLSFGSLHRSRFCSAKRVIIFFNAAAASIVTIGLNEHPFSFSFGYLYTLARNINFAVKKGGKREMNV